LFPFDFHTPVQFLSRKALQKKLAFHNISQKTGRSLYIRSNIQPSRKQALSYHYSVALSRSEKQTSFQMYPVLEGRENSVIHAKVR